MFKLHSNTRISHRRLSWMRRRCEIQMDSMPIRCRNPATEWHFGSRHFGPKATRKFLSARRPELELRNRNYPFQPERVDPKFPEQVPISTSDVDWHWRSWILYIFIWTIIFVLYLLKWLIFEEENLKIVSFDSFLFPTKNVIIRFDSIHTMNCVIPSVSI